MSVLIKGMEMPTNCWFCSVKSWDDDEYVCPFSGRTIKSGDANRHEDCPLIELPDHGDLIDRDALLKHGCDVTLPLGNLPVILSYVKGAPVVIPAERSENGET